MKQFDLGYLNVCAPEPDVFCLASIREFACPLLGGCWDRDVGDSMFLDVESDSIDADLVDVRGSLLGMERSP